MKVVLAAINTKYIHSNLAVYSLKAYSENEFPGEMEIAEYTINQYTEDIIRDLYRKKPDILVFSCYIWNRRYITDIVPEIKKILPHVQIWTGGPEASYSATDMLKEISGIDGIMYGEGEKVFNNMMHFWKKCIMDNEKYEPLAIKGIVYRTETGIKRNEPEEVMDMSDIPFVYKDMSRFENKIIYYESSRGCPFLCSYCLSSIDKQLRFRKPGLVKEELKFFLDNKVKQVKFVDRTFNCNKKHAMDIWRYIYENDNGITNFHFEISADLIDDEQIELLRKFRPGLAQFEIGVQTTNDMTIKAINRTMNLDKLKNVVKKINGGQNIHQHLDLIAGLPYEDYNSFVKSFNDVYKMEPEQLQLGFLKVLKGSMMSDRAEEYGIACGSNPPYEVLYTNWLSYDDVIHLKGIEEMVEVYYNSGQFSNTVKFLQHFYNEPFELFDEMAAYYDSHNYFGVKHSRMSRYEILYDMMKESGDIPMDKLEDVMLYDLYLRENIKSRPSFYKKPLGDRSKIYELQRQHKEAGNLVHAEMFRYNPEMLAVEGDGERCDTYILFDYRERDALNYNAERLLI